MFGWVMLLWFFAIGAAGAAVHHAPPRGPARGQPALRGQRSSPTTACTASCCSARSCCASPAARRCTPTWATSARTPIRIAWSLVVFPGLLLNYFGQGALFLEQRQRRVATRSTISSSGTPFLIPMVILATMAAIIASQALISGAFSLTNQAVQLGYVPRVTVVHTSHKPRARSTSPRSTGC